MTEFLYAVGTALVLWGTWPAIRRSVVGWHRMLTDSSRAFLRGIGDGIVFWRRFPELK